MGVGGVGMSKGIMVPLGKMSKGVGENKADTAWDMINAKDCERSYLLRKRGASSRRPMFWPNVVPVIYEAESAV
jgi:hypothetical protein